MEVSVFHAEGIELDSIVSIRVGSVRRQAPLRAGKPFLFPAPPPGTSSIKVDVYKAVATAELKLRPAADSYSIRFPTPPSSPPQSLTLQVRGPETREPTQPAAVGAQPEDLAFSPVNIAQGALVSHTHRTAMASARAYLDKFLLLGSLQDCLCYLLREKPEDPFAFLSLQMQRRSRELPPLPGPLPADRGGSMQVTADSSLAELNARLTAENGRLRAELERLQPLGEEWRLLDTPPGSADPLAAVPLGQDSASTDLNRQLRLEHEELRGSVSRLVLALAGCVGKTPPNAVTILSPAVIAKQEAAAERDIVLQAANMSCIPITRTQGTIGRFDYISPHADQVEEPEDSSDELKEPPREILRNRGRGISAEAYGAWNNRRAAFVPPVHKKSEEQRGGLLNAFFSCPLFAHVNPNIIGTVVSTMPVETFPPATLILKQGQDGDSLYVILSGAVECFDDTSGNKFICRIPSGRIFGELAMLYSTPRKLSVYSGADQPAVLAKLGRSVYQNLIVRHQMKIRERREECLRQVRVLETLSSEQIAQLADTLDLRMYRTGEVIVQQGDAGDEFFIVQSGECSATVETGQGEGENDVQEHRRYYEGDLFGERALLKSTTRAATVTAMKETEVLCLSRTKFERMLGPLSLLQAQNYINDPRKSISDFYQFGDQRGCRGSCVKDPAFDPNMVSPEERTDWFAVYRPTSRDAIAKMLSGAAVGKGLNVKGKSAKRGRQSGFVPFLQISLNADKALLSPPQADARCRVFYLSEDDRERMLGIFEPLLDPEDGVEISGDRVIFYVDLYPGVYGLDIPEPVLREVYITRADITFQVGWETGRKSEPAFMDMNFYGLRSSSEPKIVLFQSDAMNVLNPHGLLIAYAEKTVKPVVSDFDTFLVGSRNMDYDELPPDQTSLEAWSLDHTEGILATPGPGSWTSRWLNVIKEAAGEGFYPKVPKFGFGDATSYRLINEVVEATKETGAIRHGAECFNFFFPQELDDEYLVIWDGFEDKAWEYLDEDDLRDWLMERVQEGFVFPMNPVWLVRDNGWFEIVEKLQQTEAGQKALAKYFPPTSGVLDRIIQITEEYPDGFLPNGTGVGCSSRKSAFLDLDGGERADLIMRDVEAGIQVTLAKMKHRDGDVVDGE